MSFTSRILATATFFLSAIAYAGEPSPPRWKIESHDRQNIEAKISYELHTTTYIVTRWMAYLPEPPELPSQTNIKVTTKPKSKLVSERSALARKVRLLDIAVPNPSPASKLELEMEVQATLRTRWLAPLAEGETPPKVAALTPTETKYYTSPGRDIDFKAKPFKAWLEKKQLQIEKGELPIDFAERVLQVIRDDYTYGYNLSEKKASLCCDKGTLDCSGMSFLFVAAMRANAIPARILIGRFAKPRKPDSRPGDQEYDQPHVRAEFYVTDIGWIAVDVSDANVMKFKKVREFIGYDPGNMLVLHVDVDLKLPFPDQVETAEGLQVTPGYWAHGKGAFDAKFGDSGWDVTTTPIKK